MNLSTESVKVEGLEHRFGLAQDTPPVLAGIDLVLRPGEIVIMTGPSGSGKTTLLTLIGALRSVQNGSLQVLNQELRGQDSNRLVAIRRRIGFIFQAHNLFDSLTARQNVRLALELDPASPQEMNQRADALLERLGLGHRTEYKPQDLSGGQRQRVAVARALVNRPPLVLADEPTAALDEQAGRQVVDLLRELAEHEGTTVLIVTHDPRIIDSADRIVNMVDGAIASNILVQETLEVCEFLARCSMFKSMPPERLTEISQKIKVERYPKGELIVEEGDTGDKFFIVRVGQVSVFAQRGKRMQRVAMLESGEFFGEAALLTGEPRSATVRSDTAVALYSLDKASFEAALNSSGTFRDQLREVFFRRH